MSSQKKKKSGNKCKKLIQKQTIKPKEPSCYLFKFLYWKSWVTLHLLCIFISQVQVQRSHPWPCSHSSVPSGCFLHKAVLQSTTKAVSITMQLGRNTDPTVSPTDTHPQGAASSALTFRFFLLLVCWSAIENEHILIFLCFLQEFTIHKYYVDKNT